jgi:hypothetical protein
MRFFAVCRLAAVAVLLSSLPAHAQTEAAKSQALKRYQEGVALHDKGHEEEAYLRFVEAYAVVQTPPILFNLARTEQLTGRHVAAAEHFRAYLAIPEHPRVTPALRAKAQGFVTELQPLLGHLDIDAPAGAAVSVDGKPVAGRAVEVEPGAHAVAAKVGDREVFQNVTVIAGGTAPVHLEVAAPVAVPVVVPTPVVVAPPPVAPPVAPAPPERYWITRRKVGLAVAGLGAAGLVLGGVFGADRGSDTSNASAAAATVGAGNSACFRSTSAACSSLASALQSNGTNATLEAAFLTGGGVLLVAGAVTTLWPSSAQGANAAAALVPSVGPRGVGLSWSGSF